MLKRTVLAIALTLIPLFAAVTTVNAATYYSIFDIFRLFSLRKPTAPTYNLYNPTIPTATNSPTPLPSAVLTNTPTPSVTTTPTPRLDAQQPLVETQTPTSIITPSPTSKTIPTNTQTPTPTMRTVSPTSVVLSTSDDSIKTYIMNEINSYRKSQGLYEVHTDSLTCSFAKVRAIEITTNFNHAGFTNRISSNSLPYPSYSKVTENIAMNSNYQRVVTQWKNSSGHAENMRADTPFVCVEKYGNYYAYEGWKS